MATSNIHGFYTNVVDATEPREYQAKEYLKTQLLFLKRLSSELDTDTKAGAMVGMQIPNLEMAIEELSI
ncbi:hypothetical protein RQW99_08955 [Leuconostoc falkenbergense]|uniref:hypothetical protein n=1 Tax=Leuconostoc falkenbergense TaxID=2766470 RepID=UPI002A806F1C|nr:hypothetical protein [Leuconostoc falkenbergense]MDY5164658.1 hypothetical protein [Leuconostoc falkenbergense]